MFVDRCIYFTIPVTTNEIRSRTRRSVGTNERGQRIKNRRKLRNKKIQPKLSQNEQDLEVENEDSFLDENPNRGGESRK